MIINERKAGVILSYILTVTNAVVGFLLVPILIYFLGTGEFGLYQLMASILAYMAIMDFGLSHTITRYYSQFIALGDNKSKENLLAISAIIYTGIALLILILGTTFYFVMDGVFGSSLTKTEIISAKKMFLIILINIAITLPSYLFKAVITSHEKFIFIKGLEISQVLFRPILIVAVFSIQSSAVILVVIQSTINIIGIAITVYYFFKKTEAKIRLHYWDMPLLKEMLKYSFYIFLTAVMNLIFWRTDEIIIGVLIGTVAVASYSIASQITLNYMALSTAMSGVFLPNITKRVMENASNQELTNIFIKVGRLQYLLLGSVLCGFILFGQQFIRLWVGTDFHDSYYIAIIIMIPFTIDLIQNIGLSILQAKNLYAFRAKTFFWIAVLNIVCSIPLVIHFGGIGAAFSTAISFLIGNGVVMNLYYYKKVNLNIGQFWNEIFKITIPMIFVFIIGFLINCINFWESDVLSLISKILLFLICYAFIMWKYAMQINEKDLVLIPLRRFGIYNR